MRCRHCHSPVTEPFLDLGTAPPSNAYLTAEALDAPETWFPLRVKTCTTCWLVQTEDHAGAAELFAADYAYFSAFSTTWLAHAEQYVDAAIGRFALGPQSLVVEVASNDGYLLQFVVARGVPCLGVEPTAGTAAVARARGIVTREAFFGTALATEMVAAGEAADLAIANNVLAHVPDINDFAAAFAILLKPDGVATFEFPHLVALVRDRQFDTIYHEHYSYLALTTVVAVFAAAGLRVFDVELLPTHGGSLRVYTQRSDCGTRGTQPSVAAVQAAERAAGVGTIDFYRRLQPAAERIKDDLLAYLIAARRSGRRVAAYGAAAKGNTLLNFAGVRRDLLPWVVDRNPAKQGKFLPGSRIPIVDEDHLRRERPDDILILPWNLRDEIIAQLGYAGAWGARFVTAVPALTIA